MLGGKHLTGFARSGAYAVGCSIMAIGWIASLPGCLVLGIGGFIADRAERRRFEPFDEPYGDVVPWPTDFETLHARSIPTKEQQGAA